ncbi:hypothetical protein [Pandoraea communis]|uniref:hypothetical protein n=1 Tax=Pandoraea communis TaxID=2508297 RepID=UPI0025A5DB7E|nr:hypothetical protein [Pandoraea communis]MDM8356641.1 hypothetical protein [Pandoraea communis]
MTQVTLEAIRAKTTELAEMISDFTNPQINRIEIPATVVELRPGEHYAGEILNEDGTIKHRLAFAAISAGAAHTWEDAGAFAKNLGLSRPTVPEARLLLANCRPHLPEEGWFWTDDAYEQNAAYAWNCYLCYGHTDYYHKSYEGLAVAVRRF